MGWEVACECEGVWVCSTMSMPGGVEDGDGGLTRAEAEAMTPGVVTEWYRAPEVFLIPHAAKVAYYSTALGM